MSSSTPDVNPLAQDHEDATVPDAGHGSDDVVRLDRKSVV